MVAHTPAPWTYEVHELSEGLAGVVYGPDEMRIGTDHLSEADARLIAAAPDMLAALRKAWHELNTIRAADGVPYTAVSGIISKSSVDEQYFSDVVEECRAAIAKAEPAP